jgi:hypothetical protein
MPADFLYRGNPSPQERRSDPEGVWGAERPEFPCFGLVSGAEREALPQQVRAVSSRSML